MRNFIERLVKLRKFFPVIILVSVLMCGAAIADEPTATAPAPKIDTGDTAWVLISDCSCNAYDPRPGVFLRRAGSA